MKTIRNTKLFTHLTSLAEGISFASLYGLHALTDGHDAGITWRATPNEEDTGIDYAISEMLDFFEDPEAKYDIYVDDAETYAGRVVFEDGTQWDFYPADEFDIRRYNSMDGDMNNEPVSIFSDVEEVLREIGDFECDGVVRTPESIIFSGEPESFEVVPDDGRSSVERAVEYIRGTLESIAGHLRTSSVYVYVDGNDGKIRHSVLTGNTEWNCEGEDVLTHVFPAFSGGSPEMVNDHYDLLRTWENEDTEYDAVANDMSVAYFLEKKGSSIAERQMEAWIEELNISEYEVK